VTAPWPELPFAAWQDTCRTLHLWSQIVGKTRLALAPMENHWWQVTLYLTARGLTTSAMPAGGRTMTVDFDLIEHQLEIRLSDGSGRRLPLRPGTVADFHAEYLAALRGLGVALRIRPVPVEMETAISFPEDRGPAAYEADAAHRWWQLLARADEVLKRFRGRFLGKASPVHFFWGSFDLAATRFSGRPAPPHPGGAPHVPGYVMTEAYSHECSSCGFWPGGGALAEPGFYAYAYPQPPGYPEHRVVPDGARYSSELGEFILPGEALRAATDPDGAVLEFLQSTYEAAADLGRWDRGALDRPRALWP